MTTEEAELELRAMFDRAWRYGGHDPRVPDTIRLSITGLCDRVSRQGYKGRVFFRFTEGYFQVIDPAGAGVVTQIERGLVRRVEISGELAEPTSARAGGGSE